MFSSYLAEEEIYAENMICLLNRLCFQSPTFLLPLPPDSC